MHKAFLHDLRVLCCRFLTDIYSEAHPGPSLRLKKTVQVVILQLEIRTDCITVDNLVRTLPDLLYYQVETHRVLLREGAGVNLTLTIGLLSSQILLLMNKLMSSRPYLTLFKTIEDNTYL